MTKNVLGHWNRRRALHEAQRAPDLQRREAFADVAALVELQEAAHDIAGGGLRAWLRRICLETERREVLIRFYAAADAVRARGLCSRCGRRGCACD